MAVEQLINATCPECRGPLHEIRNDVSMPMEFECLVGHRYSPEGLLQGHYEAEERALWAAVVALEKAQNIVRAVAEYMPADVLKSLQTEAEQKNLQAKQIRELLNDLRPLRTG